jgi:hypothetical protein
LKRSGEGEGEREAEEIYMSNLYAAYTAKLYIQTQICTVNIKGRVFHHAA